MAVARRTFPAALALLAALPALAALGACGGGDDAGSKGSSTPVETAPESKVRVEPVACEIDGTTVRYRASVRNDEAGAIEAELETVVQEPKGGVAGSARGTATVAAGATAEVEVVVTLPAALPDGGICAARVVRADPTS